MGEAIFYVGAEIARCQGLYYIACSMVAAHIAEYGLVDGAGDVELAYWVLCDAHVGETLVG